MKIGCFIPTDEHCRLAGIFCSVVELRCFSFLEKITETFLFLTQSMAAIDPEAFIKPAHDVVLLY